MTLTQVSKLFRQGIIWFILAGIIYYLFVLFLFPGAEALFLSIFPPKDPPTPIFGQLPPLEFVEQKTKNVETPIFKLDTKDGRLPKDIPRKLTVYKINRTIPSFEKGKDAIETASRLGFIDDDLVSNLKDTVYEWKKLASDGVLKINTDTTEIDLKTPLEGKSEVFPRGSISTSLALEDAITFLRSIGRLDDELYSIGTQEITLGRYNGQKVEKTTNALDAQMARVDFFRSLDDYPITTPNPREGLINITLRKFNEEELHYNFPQLETHIWNINTQSNATYALLTPTEAWNLLKTDKAVIVDITPENSSNFDDYTPVTVEEVFINNIYLAYYDSADYQQYLQPIYVFEGKYTTAGTQGGRITYYYPAIVPEWIKPTQ